MQQKPKPPPLNPTPDLSPGVVSDVALWKRVELALQALQQEIVALQSSGGGGSGTPYPGPMAPVEVAGSPGSDPRFARGDHAHEGLHSVAAIVGGTKQAQLLGDYFLAADPGGTVRQDTTNKVIYLGSRGTGTNTFCPQFGVRLTTSDTTLEACDSILLCDCSHNSINVYLPPSANGQFYSVKKIDSTANLVTLIAPAGELIDNANPLFWNVPDESFAVVGDGSQWWIPWWYNPMAGNNPNVTIIGAGGQPIGSQQSNGQAALATTDLEALRLHEESLVVATETRDLLRQMVEGVEALRRLLSPQESINRGG